MKENLTIMLDPEEKPYIHLIDGGVADNLGLRAIEEAIDSVGNIWTVMRSMRNENVHKVVFVVVNAETKIESIWDKTEIMPELAGILSNYTTIAIVRYNRETMAVLQESFERWTHQIRAGRCPPGQESREPGSCGDIQFYLIDVRFENHKVKTEGDYLAGLPTSFLLGDKDVDKLRAGAREILSESADFQKLLRDLGKESLSPKATGDTQ